MQQQAEASSQAADEARVGPERAGEVVKRGSGSRNPTTERPRELQSNQIWAADPRSVAFLVVAVVVANVAVVAVAAAVVVAANQVQCCNHGFCSGLLLQCLPVIVAGSVLWFSPSAFLLSTLAQSPSP